MSQSGIISTTSSPSPPTVATSYVTNVNSPAIPAANVLNVFGGETTANSANGIETDGSSGSNTLTILLTNRAQTTATTSDGGGQTQIVNIFTPPSSKALEYSANIIGYDAVNNQAVGGALEGIARVSSGGVVTIVGTNDTFDEADSGLISADWNIVTNGTNIQAEFVGVAGRTISWTAVFTYVQTP